MKVILYVALVVSIAAAAVCTASADGQDELRPRPGAPPLDPDALADPLAYAERILSSADPRGKVKPAAAAQLLSDVQALGQSLAGGVARARGRALQARRAARACSSLPPQQRGTCLAALAANSPGPPPEPSAERGVLVVAGGIHGLSNAYILVRALRRTGCRLPVEVVYYGFHEYHAPTARLLLDLNSDEPDDDYSAAGGEQGGGGGGGGGDATAGEGAAGGAPADGECPAGGGEGAAGQQCGAAAAPTSSQAEPRPTVRLIDGLAYHQEQLLPLEPHRQLPIRSFATKVHALCFVTSFEQALLLDADNMPLQDPTFLFSDPAYTHHRNLFWPDFWTDMWVNLSIYRLLSMDVPWEADPKALAGEAGQLLIDRVTHYDVIEYLWLLATHPEVVGACVWGDKDTYRMAFHLAGKGAEYTAVSAPPRQLLGARPPPPGSSGGDGAAPATPLHHLGMAQLAPDGRSVLFYHRTAAGKFFPHCIARWGGATEACVPRFVTLPVDQPQLLASVADPTEMVFQPSAVDATWHEAHCAPAAKPGGADGAAAVAGVGSLLLPECQPGWEGRRPIPLLPVGRVPGLEAALRWAHDDAFLPLLAYHSASRRSG